MQIAILSTPSDLSDYLTEILHTWGLTISQTLMPGDTAHLDPVATPVALCPAHDGSNPHDQTFLSYVRQGGTGICFLPTEMVARSAGLIHSKELELPLRLRVSEFPVSGLAGEQLPVVGRAVAYHSDEGTRPLAYLNHPGVHHGEVPGITETKYGKGRIIVFAFDLARCILLLRQGDPTRSEIVPDSDGCARPSHLATDLGAHASGWVPYADLMGRLLVDLILRSLPLPVPMLSHLPGSAPAILLYSGDEDFAETDWNYEQLEAVSRKSGRMNLYIIPNRTRSSTEDILRYRQSHDVGPHPDLRPLDGEPMVARLTEFERQICLFEDNYGIKARSLRNHCTAWAGYLEPVEVMQRLGVRMDANYFSGCYLRDRQHAPYAAFGSALPMRFCQPDGRLMKVYQQHTHLTDDGAFGAADYSYRLSPQLFAVELDRIFRDISTRFHTPYAVCIHPSNWVRFSRFQGLELLDQAARFGIPIWSFDRWLDFWEARSSCMIQDLLWDGVILQFSVTSRVSHSDTHFHVPQNYEGKYLDYIKADGERVETELVTRYGRVVALFLPVSGHSPMKYTAHYVSD
jgi:hypothetical protein